MKLELFNYVDDVLALYDYHYIEIVGVNNEIRKYFTEELMHDDRLVNISTRIKTQESLREKLIRRNFYLRFPDPVAGFKMIQDIVGVRLECRFIKDEEDLYKKIIKDFTIKCENGFYASNKNKKIRLNLEDEQPQVMLNGFKMYKLDGSYYDGEILYSFELQIKSLVNVFWGEIDHKLLYKNYNYMITANFFREIMNSISDNLTMVDKQLMILYNHVKKQDASETLTAEMQLKKLLSKILHDVFTKKILDELGMFINLKTISEVVVDFLFLKSQKNKDLTYGENFISLINKINSLSSEDMDIEEYLVFKKKPKYYDSFSKEITDTLYKIVNKDFEWNILFKIIKLITTDTNRENFTDFIIFIRYDYTFYLYELFEKKEFSVETRDNLENTFLEEVADRFKEKPSLDFLLDESLEKFDRAILKMMDSDSNSEEEMLRIFRDIYSF